MMNEFRFLIGGVNDCVSYPSCPPHLSGQVQFYTDNRIEKFSLDLTIQRPLKAEKFSGWRARSAPSPRKSIERRKMEKMM